MSKRFTVNQEKILLFDLGGVLIDIDFKPVFAQLETMSNLSIDEIKARFQMDEMYKRHETGQVSWSQYAEHLRSSFSLVACDSEIVNAWNAIFKGEITQTVCAIESITDKIRCFMFSNTNPTHQQFWLTNYPDVVNLFEQVFVSSELGLRKPDAASFKAVSQIVKCDLENFIFFDDTAENIKAAANLGMKAVLVSHPEDVKNELSRLNF